MVSVHKERKFCGIDIHVENVSHADINIQNVKQGNIDDKRCIVTKDISPLEAFVTTLTAY
jgi:hypothetical protein